MIEGRFFDGERSVARRARLEIAMPDVVRLFIGDASDPTSEAWVESRRWDGRLADVEISERVGSIPRRVTVPGLGVFETRDNDAVDGALAALGRPFELVHWLEDRWPIAITSLFAIAVGSFFFVRYGVPAIADFAARTLPPSIDGAIGARTLELLDGRLLEPSELEPERQAELRERFAQMIVDGESEARIRSDVANGGKPRPEAKFAERLELRAAPALGPNALALPSGIIIMTDELVALAEHDDELVAVLAHELGHVRGRHALRRLFQSVSVSALAFALVGDISSASALFSAVPALIDAKHSRDFEREADGFAKAWLVHHGIPPFRFDAILCRMERGGPSGDGDTAHAGDDDLDGFGAPDDDSGANDESVHADAEEPEEPQHGRARPERWSRYLSTHPTTDERVRCTTSAVSSDERAEVWKDLRKEASRTARDSINAPASPRPARQPAPAAPDS